MKKISCNSSSYLKPLVFSVATMLLPWSVEAQFNGLDMVEISGASASSNFFEQYEGADIYAGGLAAQDYEVALPLELITEALMDRYAQDDWIVAALRTQIEGSIHQAMNFDEELFDASADLVAIIQKAQQVVCEKLEAGQQINKQWCAQLYMLLILRELDGQDSAASEALLAMFAQFIIKHFIDHEQTTTEERTFAHQALLLSILESITAGYQEVVEPLIVAFLKLNSLERQAEQSGSSSYSFDDSKQEASGEFIAEEPMVEADSQAVIERSILSEGSGDQAAKDKLIRTQRRIISRKKTSRLKK